jgi:phosphate starvation-inducible PhoH-like protein
MEKFIKINDREELQALFGCRDQNIRLIEKEFKVKISVRSGDLRIHGLASNIAKAVHLIDSILENIRQNPDYLKLTDIRYLLQNQAIKTQVRKVPVEPLSTNHVHKNTPIGPKTAGQSSYVEAIRNNDIVFGLGPAGTGKTYLAMATAVEALKRHDVRRIILTRPALEAGESLGYLPGDMYEKISPYLRPLYDALYDMLEAETIEKYLETGIIEVVPLAYMRGRTLNDAFIVLDEAQNCTAEQMKMFLTRLGFDSKAVITGDMTQSDLPTGKPLGLLQAREILKDIKGIKFICLTGMDVVRHAIVQKIIEAYDKAAGAK